MVFFASGRTVDLRVIGRARVENGTAWILGEPGVTKGGGGVTTDPFANIAF